MSTFVPRNVQNTIGLIGSIPITRFRLRSYYTFYLLFVLEHSYDDRRKSNFKKGT
jgi:hypothetical protein